MILKKELQETWHWLKMLKTVDERLDLDKLAQECQELILIFQAITAKLK